LYQDKLRQTDAPCAIPERVPCYSGPNGMFINKTVFILGAGASWHYGYPTGEELVEQVREKARVFHGYCAKIVQQNRDSATVQIPRFLSRNTTGTFTDGLQGMRRAWEAGRDEGTHSFSALQRSILWSSITFLATILNCSALASL
jgi:hypothetical protein